MAESAVLSFMLFMRHTPDDPCPHRAGRACGDPNAVIADGARSVHCRPAVAVGRFIQLQQAEVMVACQLPTEKPRAAVAVELRGASP